MKKNKWVEPKKSDSSVRAKWREGVFSTELYGKCILPQVPPAYGQSSRHWCPFSAFGDAADTALALWRNGRGGFGSGDGDGGGSDGRWRGGMLV